MADDIGRHGRSAPDDFKSRLIRMRALRFTQSTGGFKREQAFKRPGCLHEADSRSLVNVNNAKSASISRSNSSLSTFYVPIRKPQKIHHPIIIRKLADYIAESDTSGCESGIIAVFNELIQGSRAPLFVCVIVSLEGCPLSLLASRRTIFASIPSGMA